jgi:hypothetical protein
MSTNPVDVLAVMESDAKCAAESRGRHYDREVWWTTAANSVAARAAVAELVAASKEFREAARALNAKKNTVRKDGYAAAALRLDRALAACGVQP